MERQNILSFMTNNKELLLVHASMYTVRPEHTINVMLTPQFYTLKKEALPVKYAYQAKKIAPSLFEGLLEEGGEYEYLVFKEEVNEEEQWVFIAYDIEKITDFLESKGIEAEHVAKVFFVQQSMKEFKKGSLPLGEHDALTVIDDTVVVVPAVALGEEHIHSLRFTNGFTPTTAGVKIKSKPTEQSTLMTQTQAFSLAAIFLLFAGMFTVEGSRYGGDVQAEQEEMDGIYETHAYLKSTYARQDEITKYKTIDAAERHKRDAVKISSKMIFKGVLLTELKVDEKNFIAKFECSNTEVAKRVKAIVKKSKDNLFTVEGDTTLTLKGQL